MCNPYQSASMAPCYDSESPVEDAPIETPAPEIPTEEIVTLFSVEDVEARLAEKDAEWEARLAAKDSEVAAIKGKYDGDTLTRALGDAAHQGKAYSPEVVMAFLKPHTRVVDGEPIIELEGFRLSPSEAIGWMRSQVDRFGTLFKSDALGGLGANSTADGMRRSRRPDIKTMSSREYRQLREANPREVGFPGGDE